MVRNISTNLAHAGDGQIEKVFRTQHSVPEVLPVYMTSVFAFDDVKSVDDIYEGVGEGFVYSRMSHPNNDAAAIALAQADNAEAALVTSGTATLETALFHVPQVVCYKTPLPHLMRFAFNHIIKCRYISLVNLIANREVVLELFADRFSVNNIRKELHNILGSKRQQMLSDYKEIEQLLSSECAPDNAAHIMVQSLAAQAASA